MAEELIDLNYENVLGGGSGIKLNLGHSRQRAIFWRATEGGDWVQTRPLPADPFSISYYYAKGFRASPPEVVKETVEVKVSESSFPCSCGFEAKSAFGLSAHQKKHKKSL